MGHSFMRLPHLVQVTMCPHSSRTQSMGESMQILHRFSSRLDGTAPPVQTWQKREARGHEIVSVYRAGLWCRLGENGYTEQISKPHTFLKQSSFKKTSVTYSRCLLDSHLLPKGYRLEEYTIWVSNTSQNMRKESPQCLNKFPTTEAVYQ